MVNCATETKNGLDELAYKVANRIVDVIDFDAVSAQVHHANVKAMEARHESEQLRREIEDMRRMIEKVMFESEQKLRLVG